MGFRRYVAPTAREALERIRKELGADAVILSNRRAGPNRVEIIAAAQGQMDALVDDFVPAAAPAPLLAPAGRKPSRPAVAASVMAPAPARRTAPESFQEFIRRQSAEPAIRNEGLDMYQQVAREMDESPVSVTMARASASRGPVPLTAPAPAPRQPALPAAPPPAVRSHPVAMDELSPPAVFRRRPSRIAAPAEMPAAVPAAAVAPVPPAPQPIASVRPPLEEPVAPVAATPHSAPLPAAAQPQAVVVAPAPPIAPVIAQDRAAQSALLQGSAAVAPLPDSRLVAELQSLRSTLNDRISRLEVRLAQAEPAVPEATVAAPVASVAAAEAVVLSAAPAARAAEAAPSLVRRQVMTRLIMSGFSPQLSRRVGDAAPATLDPKGTDAWLHQVIGQYVRCPADVENPLLTPGAVALVGPTGVGKTTTIAKIAARIVVRHGAAALGLVTLDSYRMGAHEQLRGYGRILGVPVHTAHDAASLRELLASLQGRRQILIDTCGMSQRDPRLGEMLAMIEEVRFDERPVKRALLINAASHAETLDEVARGWRVESAHGAILTKIDEAARIGGALDALMRFQTPLLGLTNGQRVPEDWHPGNPPLLAHIALKPFGAAFALDSEELQALSRTGAPIA